MISVKNMAQEIVDAYTLIDNVERYVKEAEHQTFEIDRQPMSD